ncbi:DUF4160 domain-containing protein [Algoriphagus formosus]|uniref:DUF4160 domain-containing protein n=1 Tax=Algoriphagus formosus TaxID=2007308 RepID=UPI002938DB25|nr:DUF4160 domain-containing protein [Algoriphagus aquimaris]
MPTIMNQKGYRFFFYSNDHLPKHIHVEKAEKPLNLIWSLLNWSLLRSFPHPS